MVFGQPVRVAWEAGGAGLVFRGVPESRQGSAPSLAKVLNFQGDRFVQVENGDLIAAYLSPIEITARHADSAYEGNMMEWRNQMAVVTGGARGLGRATARLLAHRGPF